MKDENDVVGCEKSFTECPYRFSNLTEFACCEHGNNRHFCNQCRYVPYYSFTSTSTNEVELLSLREEVRRLTEENNFLRGAVIRESSTIDDFIVAKRQIQYLEHLLEIR